MRGSASEPPAVVVDGKVVDGKVVGSEASDGKALEPFVESDYAETQFIYDDGGTPWFIGVIWISFLVCYVAYMVVYALPDWNLW